MGIGPVPASRKALERAGLEPKDIDLVELNEAFASQVLASMRELGFEHDRLNVNGGAIALGHPLGASGARLLGTLAWELRRRGARYGLATMCIGVGQGLAAVIENPAAALEAAVSSLALPPQRLAVESDAASISDLMRISVLELFPRFYDAQQTASAAVHIAHLDMQLITRPHLLRARGRWRAGCLRWLEPPQQALLRARRCRGRRSPARSRAASRRGCERCSCGAIGRGAALAGRSSSRASGLLAMRASGTSYWARRFPASLCIAHSDFARSSAFDVTMPDGVSVECVGMERPIGPLPPART